MKPFFGAVTISSAIAFLAIYFEVGKGPAWFSLPELSLLQVTVAIPVAFVALCALVVTGSSALSKHGTEQ